MTLESKTLDADLSDLRALFDFCKTLPAPKIEPASHRVPYGWSCDGSPKTEQQAAMYVVNYLRAEGYSWAKCAKALSLLKVRNSIGSAWTRSPLMRAYKKWEKIVDSA